MNDRQFSAALDLILVADDEPTMQIYLGESMKQDGYKVVSTTDGGEALQILRGVNAPSLAILDWHMPTLDGIEVCRRIRNERDHGLLYLIMVSGFFFCSIAFRTTSSFV